MAQKITSDLRDSCSADFDASELFRAESEPSQAASKNLKFELKSYQQTGPEGPEQSLKPSSHLRRTRQDDRQHYSKRSGHWTADEKVKYFEFLARFKANFERRELRRQDKIFKIMSEHLKTRAADQCRSHHQKMQKKYGSFQAILEQCCQKPTLTPITPITQSENIVQERSPEAGHWDMYFATVADHLSIEHFLRPDPPRIDEVTSTDPDELYQSGIKATLTEEFDDGVRSGYLPV